MLGCADLTAVVETFKVAYDGFAIVTTTGVEVLRAGKHGTQTMDNIRFGLQYLRENPKLFVSGVIKFMFTARVSKSGPLCRRSNLTI